MFKIEKNGPLYVQVYEQIKRSIIEGDLEPGEKLIESKIASDMNISRSPIREAFRILEHEGMVVKKNQNLHIHTPSVKDIVELYQLRFSLESLTCYLAAQVRNDQEIIQLKEILNDTEQALEAQDLKQVYECNTLFHETIIQISGNTHLVSILDNLRDKIFYCRNVLLQLDYVRLDSFFSEHFNIYIAIKEGRAEVAKKLMEEHVRVDLDRILKLFPDEKIKGGL